MKIVELSALLSAALPLAYAAAAAAAPSPKSQYPACVPTMSYEADAAPRVALPRKLTDLPPAKVYYTVLHNVDGCPVPVLASQRVIGAKR